MRSTLSTLCNNFIENRDAIKSDYIWESSYMYPVAAAIFTGAHQQADAGRLKEAEYVLKDNTGIFSNFRGTLKLPMIALLGVSANPEEKMQNALEVYRLLKELFWNSTYLPVASMVIAGLVAPQKYSAVAARTRHIYELMKQEHPFLTSAEDSVFAALLALSDLTDEQIVQQTESCYQLLREEFFSGNAIQSLSHVLAIGQGSPEAKCRRLLNLYYALKENGMRYGREYELPTLGVLSMLPVGIDALTMDVAQVDEYLADQRGYGLFGVGRKQRLMHAAMLVACDYADGENQTVMNTAALNGTIALIIAQEMAICATIAASSAAAAASSAANS